MQIKTTADFININAGTQFDSRENKQKFTHSNFNQLTHFNFQYINFTEI